MRPRSLTAGRSRKQRSTSFFRLVRFAPSALNLQPWKIKVVTDQKIKEQLRPIAFDQEQVTTCSHLLVFCADPDYEGLIRKLEALLKKNHVPEDVQKMVLGMANQFTQPMSKEQKLAWSQAQVYLALGNALNGAKALGFDSCPMGGFDPKEMARVLKIPAPLVPTMLCPVGTRPTSPCRKRGLQKRILFSKTSRGSELSAIFSSLTPASLLVTFPLHERDSIGIGHTNHGKTGRDKQ